MYFYWLLLGLRIKDLFEKSYRQKEQSRESLEYLGRYSWGVNWDPVFLMEQIKEAR